MDFLVDKTNYFTFKNEGNGDAAWPYDKPQYLILNIAIGGAWGGQRGIDDSIFPQRMYIDYVRVYRNAGQRHGDGLGIGDSGRAAATPSDSCGTSRTVNGFDSAPSPRPTSTSASTGLVRSKFGTANWMPRSYQP